VPIVTAFYEVQHLFFALQGHLIKFKLLDQPAGATKDQMYRWLSIEESTVASAGA
jgi:hypothetical protein